MKPNHPQAFLPTSTGAAPFQQQGLRIVEIPATATPPPKKANSSPLRSRKLAALSITPPKENDQEIERGALIVLSKPLQLAIPALKHKHPIEIVPSPRGGTWHLDTRPTAGRLLRVTAEGAASFHTSHQMKKEYFLRPPKTIGQPNEILPCLYFRLGPEAAPGYFTLLPLYP